MSGAVALDEIAIRHYLAPPGLLAGRVIAVTGAGDGVGRAVALAAAERGARLVLIGRTVKRLEAVHAQIAAGGAIWNARWLPIMTAWPRPSARATAASTGWCTALRRSARSPRSSTTTCSPGAVSFT